MRSTCPALSCFDLYALTKGGMKYEVPFYAFFSIPTVRLLSQAHLFSPALCCIQAYTAYAMMRSKKILHLYDNKLNVIHEI
jgi:hypothetical protein